jgi:dihydrofolate reductase
MGKLIYVMNTSLDGFMSDRDGKIDWSVLTPELFSAFNDLQRPIGTYLYGRRLYESMAVWETLHLEPSAPALTPTLGELEREFATLWRAADKVVFSTTLSAASTPRTRIERTLDPDRVRELKAASERDLTVGGPHLAAAMLAANLVDELQTFVHPISLGGGEPWLPRDHRMSLELVGERRIGNVVHVRYRPS